MLRASWLMSKFYDRKDIKRRQFFRSPGFEKHSISNIFDAADNTKLKTIWLLMAEKKRTVNL